MLNHWYMAAKLLVSLKRAHDVDENLSAHTMLENMVSKASAVLSLLHLIRVTGIDKKRSTTLSTAAKRLVVI